MKLKEQMVPQLIPDGVLVTLPLPVFETVRLTTFGVNVAVQFLFAFIVTDAVELPAQSPVHDLNLEFAAGFGVRVTATPAPYLSEQYGSQLMPVGLLTIVPPAVPLGVTSLTTLVVKA
jgi:hypothetical protein